MDRHSVQGLVQLELRAGLCAASPACLHAFACFLCRDCLLGLSLLHASACACLPPVGEPPQ
eukprot:2465212-Alexandrium_andersonii.AAC.1